MRVTICFRLTKVAQRPLHKWLHERNHLRISDFQHFGSHASALALHEKYGVSDPLPPSAAVPLCKGDNKPILPLEKGESRVAAGGRSHRIELLRFTLTSRVPAPRY